MKNIFFIWLGGIMILGLLAYGVTYRFIQQNTATTDSGRIQVVASFYPLAHIAQQIGKEHVDVLNLTPAGSEPHDFDPSPRDVAVLQHAKLFIYNGAGLEPWVSQIVPELEEKNVRVVEATKELALLADDPHVWLDPVLYQEQVNSIAKAIAEIDSANAAVYHKNATEYIGQLNGLHQEFTTGLATCKRRDIITSHAAFAYLAKRYTLNMIPISGISPEEEPTPSRLAEIATFVQEHGVTHIFFETLVSPRLAETIARETGAQTISFNPLEGLSDEEIIEGKTYVSVQRDNLRALRTALSCL